MNVVTEIECLRPLSAAGEPGALWPAALPGGAERLIMRWRAGHSQQRSSVLSCSVSKEAGVLTVGLARLGAGEPARARQLAVEAARAAQRGVERVQAVGRADDDDAAAAVQAVHERQQRAHNAVVHLVLLAAARLRGPTLILSGSFLRLLAVQSHLTLSRSYLPLRACAAPP